MFQQLSCNAMINRYSESVLMLESVNKKQKILSENPLIEVIAEKSTRPDTKTPLLLVKLIFICTFFFIVQKKYEKKNMNVKSIVININQKQKNGKQFTFYIRSINKHSPN